MISPTQPRSIFVLIFLQIRILSLTSLNVFVLAPQVLISSEISALTSLKVLIIIFMIYEPLGMAKLWENLKQIIKFKLSSSNIKKFKSLKKT